MLSSVFRLAIFGSAPLLSGASPVFGVIATTVTATVTETRTIHLCPTASTSGSINFPVPNIFLAASPSPAANIVGGVLSSAFSLASGLVDPLASGAISIVQDPIPLPAGVLSSSGSTTGSLILPMSVLDAVTTVPTDVTAIVTSLGQIGAQLNDTNIALTSLSSTLLAVFASLSQVTSSLSSLTSAIDSTSIGLQNLNSLLYVLASTTTSGIATDGIADAAVATANQVAATADKIRTTVAAASAGTDLSAVHRSVLNFATNWNNTVTALGPHCGDSGQQRVFSNAAKPANTALNACLLKIYQNRDS